MASQKQRVTIFLAPDEYARLSERASDLHLPLPTVVRLRALHVIDTPSASAQAPASNKPQTKQIDKSANLSDEDYERFVDEVGSYNQALSMLDSGMFTKRQLEQGYRRLAMDGSPDKPEPFELTATPATIARLDKAAAEMVAMVQTIWREHESAPAPVVHHARPEALSIRSTNAGTVVSARQETSEDVAQLVAEWED